MLVYPQQPGHKGWVVYQDVSMRSLLAWIIWHGLRGHSNFSAPPQKKKNFSAPTSLLGSQELTRVGMCGVHVWSERTPTCSMDSAALYSSCHLLRHVAPP